MFTEQFQKKIKVIEMEDFLNLEFKTGGLLNWVNETYREQMLKASKSCISQKKGTLGSICIGDLFFFSQHI